ncbi:MAG: Hpt domain-containing protein [Pseudomonadota bacterium]
MSQVQQAFHVVSQELGRTVNQARVMLEDAVEGRSTRQALERCAEHLHEAGGVLKVVEIYGGALLTEEMEAVCHFMLQPGRDKKVLADCLDALTRAMVQLPAYLERMLAGGRDIALVLLPMLNDLRAVRGRPLLSESTILLLNRTPSDQVTVAQRGAEPSEDFSRLSRKVRPAFQVALLGLLRSDAKSAQRHLAKLENMALAFERAADRDDVYRLWWVVGGVIEGLREGGLELSVAVKRLLGQVDRRIKAVIDEGISNFDRDPITDLLNSLLFYVARVQNPGDKVREIRTAFSLDDALPGEAQVESAREELAAPSVALMETVAAAIREDLASVKDVLDIHVRTGEADISKLRPQIELMSKISDTLGVLGLGQQRSSVLAEVARLKGLIDETPELATSDELLAIAATLLNVESSLQRRLTQLVRPADAGDDTIVEEGAEDMGEVRRAVMRECIVNLARIKDTLSQTMAGKADHAAIDAAPALLEGIQSGFRMLELERALRVFDRLAGFVEAYLGAANHTLATDHQDRLADALVSIEYYMETIEAGRKEPAYMLDNAESCLIVLDEVRKSLESLQGDQHPLMEPTQITAKPEFGEEPEHARTATIADDTEIINAPVVAGDATQIDPELLELFIEEAKDEVANINRLLPQWQNNTGDVDSLITVRRSFHTLKGSGRMVGAERIGEYCWHVEDLLNRVINRTLAVTPAMVEFVGEASSAVPELIEQLEVGQEPNVDIGLLTAKAIAFAEGDPMAPQLSRESVAASQAGLEMDPVLHEIFAKEAGSYLAIIDNFIDGIEDGAYPAPVSDALHRAAHTLHGSINTATLERAVPLSSALNQMVRRIFDSGAGLDVDAVTLLRRASQTVRAIIDSINTPDSGAIDIQPLVRAIEEKTAAFVHEQTSLLDEDDAPGQTSYEPTEVLATLVGTQVVASAQPLDDAPDFDPEIAEIFTEEAGEVLEQVDTALELWTTARDEDALTELKRLLHTLKGGANMAGISAFGNLSHELETLLIALDDDRITANETIDKLLRQSFDTLHQMRELVLEGQQPAQMDNLEGTVRLAAIGDAAFVSALEALPDSDLTARSAIHPAPELAPQRGFAEDELIDISTVANDSDDADVGTETIGGSDTEGDLIDIGSLFGGDTAAAPDPEPESEIEMAFASEPEPESSPEPEPEPEPESEPEPELEPDVGFDDAATIAVDTPADTPFADDDSWQATQVVTSGEASDAKAGSDIEHSMILEALIDDAAAQFADGTDPDADVAEASDAAFDPNATDIVGAEHATDPDDADAVGDVAEAPADDNAEAAVEPDAETEPEAAPQGEVVAFPGCKLRRSEPGRERREVARVDSKLLEEMLNAAGEISIYHGRLSQQVSQIEFHLAELDQTVTRLREQLRHMEIETEAQILTRHEEERGREDFDPLELDRYSTIQQLSRALAETSSDVDSLRGLLQSVAGEADTLLTQQSRVTTELQSGLMRTRMVPFERHVPRLARLVRQAATETGKQAELAVEGASGELDRQVLEKMLPPLEHMMRNAVVHGIESPDSRQAAGKPPTGQITIRLHREGSEMVVDVSDDGAGLNVDAIRAKGVERELIDANVNLPDDAIFDLILEPGFSTAAQLTQAAGRGVGMDVVANEVKRLGGSLRIDSLAGQGTNFTIRLPFTLAITQALVVRAGEEVFALPLPTVEGVTRLPRAEVERMLDEPDAIFDYGEHSYRLRHLAPLVGGSGGQVLEDEQAAVPIILVRAGNHSTALLVDEMLASREIVVKSVGPQISGITGVSGATILGDGRVVLILDMPSLVRLHRPLVAPRDAAEEAEQAPVVLVVDDSITVRRVTERFLLRNGYRALTAKDGLDAVSVIQEQTPDLILLDIEMPRMDGFEFASHVRNDARFAELPIIMITSRTGEKHKARAIEIGVNDYLGKPYQDLELLKAIEQQLETTAARPAD